MGIDIVVQEEKHRAQVHAFNERMQKGGSPWGWYPDPTPDWIPKQGSHDDAPVCREYYLAVEDGERVVAGYALKPQKFWINGALHTVTDEQGPFSEGAVNARYASLGLRLIRDMQKRAPLLYSFGHGGHDEPLPKMLRQLKWLMHETPFCLYVVKPRAFFLKNQYLRDIENKHTAQFPRLSAWLKDDGQRWFARAGLGTISLSALHAGLRLKHRFESRKIPSLKKPLFEVVDHFDEWTDHVWHSAKEEYAALAVRDREMMNRLIPTHGWPSAIRLKIKSQGQVIGYALVMDRNMVKDPRFGCLRVGSIVDVFSKLKDASDVVHAAKCFLKERGVEIIISNQTHAAWVDAFSSQGFVVLKNRRTFAASPALRDLLEPLASTLPGLHLTNMDGHGPHGL